MRRCTGRTGLLLIVLSTAAGAGDTTRPAATPAELEQWWTDLAGPEPAASRALLNLGAVPDQTVPFFKDRLKPLKLTIEELEPLLADLGSEDETVWKPAFEKLETLDPRLAMPLVDLMKLVTEDRPRCRLVDIVGGQPAGTWEKYAPIKLESSGENDAYNFRGGNASWWAEVRLDRINTMSWGIQKSAWTRAVRAIVLLQHLATPEAQAIVATMAAGHPDVLPTKVAKDPAYVVPAPK